MAGSVANAKVFGVVTCNLMSKVIARRGFTAPSRGAISTAAAKGAAAAAPGRSSVGTGKEEKVAWIPDPVTGYYRPEKGGEEIIDGAELRATLLKKN